MFELTNCALGIGSFVHKIHFLGQVLSHFFAEPCEFKLGEPMFDPTFKAKLEVISGENYHSRLTERYFDHFHIDISEFLEMRMLKLYRHRKHVDISSTTRGTP